MMTNNEFCERLKYMALKRKSYYSNRYPENCLMIHDNNVMSADCIGMVKSLINDPEVYNKEQSYLINKYGKTFVPTGLVIPDTTEKGILNLCTGVSANFNKLTKGEYLYMSGHAGVYVGKFQDASGIVNVVECTPAFGNGITTSYVSNSGTRYNHKNGSSLMKWEQHGKLSKYINYEGDKKIMKWYSKKKWFLQEEETGKLLTGWIKFDNEWYYCNLVTGEMLTGFQQLKWSRGYDIFYFNESGKMLTGTQKINNKTYKFDDNGALQM